MIATVSTDAHTKAVILIRDCNGNIKLDDYDNIPDSILQVLTKEDFNYIQTIRGNR